MGRELKRVPLDFDCAIDSTWKGYINPHYTAVPCTHCELGYSPFALKLHKQWYGHEAGGEFKPEDNGSTPISPDHPNVQAFARRNLANAPDFYGTGADSLAREAARLARLWNAGWCHHLNEQDVKALLDAGRLIDFTHTWKQGEGWKPKEPAYVPTVQEVNDWSLCGFGHDSVNQWVCIKARCELAGEPTGCAHCGGSAEVWPSSEAQALYEGWEREEPPAGPGFQIWQTVSEGGPISPVFATAEELARHMTTTRWGADEGTSYETWLAFINGPGWSVSLASGPDGKIIIDGVTAAVLDASPPTHSGAGGA